MFHLEVVVLGSGEEKHEHTFIFLFEALIGFRGLDSGHSEEPKNQQSQLQYFVAGLCQFLNDDQNCESAAAESSSTRVAESNDNSKGARRMVGDPCGYGIERVVQVAGEGFSTPLG